MPLVPRDQEVISVKAVFERPMPYRLRYINEFSDWTQQALTWIAAALDAGYTVELPDGDIGNLMRSIPTGGNTFRVELTLSVAEPAAAMWFKLVMG